MSSQRHFAHMKTKNTRVEENTPIILPALDSYRSQLSELNSGFVLHYCYICIYRLNATVYYIRLGEPKIG